MSDSYEHLKSEIVQTSLTTEQLLTLRSLIEARVGKAKLESLDHQKEQDYGRIPSDTVLFYEQLSRCLESHIRAKLTPLPVLHKTNKRHYRLVSQSATHLLDQMRGMTGVGISRGDGPTKLMKSRWFNLACSLLVDWLHDCNIPVSLRTVCNNMDKVPGLMDKAFPAYASNGLLLRHVLQSR